MSEHIFKQLLADLASAVGTDFDARAQERAATIAARMFDEEALSAVAFCALTARADGRKDAYHFWFRVFQTMHDTASRAETTASEQPGSFRIASSRVSLPTRSPRRARS